MNDFKEEICIIIVLYKSTIDNCLTYNTLKNNIVNINIDYKIIIYNNYPEIKINEDKNYILHVAAENDKLAGAYNYALNYSIKTNKKWILLLDQDTEITTDYLIKLDEFLRSKYDTNTVAVIPILIYANEILSPKIISPVWWHFPISKVGYHHDRITAFNSVTLINVSFMQSLGGFSREYPLDMLDYWYFNKIYLQKKLVYVLNTEIVHNLSILNYENKIDLLRHENYLLAERKFIRNELNLIHFISYKIIFIGRFLRELFFFKDKKYSKITFKVFLLFSKKNSYPK